MKLPVVDMSRWSVPKIRVLVVESPDTEAVMVSVAASIACRDTGLPGYVSRTEHLSYVVAGNPRNLKAQIRATIAEVILHELDECLYIDGERLCAEPHPELAKP